MAFPKFLRHQPQEGEAFDLVKTQDALELWIDQLVDSIPLLDGILIEDQDLVFGTTLVIPHGLGRKWRGWFPTKLSVSTNVYDDGVPDENYLNLNITAANATISLWVF